MPKDRHDVICSSCRGALGGMYDDDGIEAKFLRARIGSPQRGLLDGLPEMTQEDLEALDGIKAFLTTGILVDPAIGGSSRAFVASSKAGS